MDDSLPITYNDCYTRNVCKDWSPKREWFGSTDKEKILEDKVNSRFSNIIGWFTFAIMTASVIVMFLSFAI